MTKTELFDPAVNISIGVKYFKYLLDYYNNDLKTAVIAYNQGMGNVNRGTYNSEYYRKVKQSYEIIENIIKSRPL